MSLKSARDELLNLNPKNPCHVSSETMLTVVDALLELRKEAGIKEPEEIVEEEKAKAEKEAEKEATKKVEKAHK